MAGITDRVEFHEGSGRDIVPKLYEEFRAGKREPIDFAINTDKPSNYLYFDYAVKMARTGAVIIVDNVVRGGAIVNPMDDPHRLVEGSRNAIEKVGADPRVASSVVQTVGEKAYDGMIVVKLTSPQLR
jgi:predicted O-methyltransferase YrrM